jgi:D-glycero-alpha-D-manno-heptose-7-phosphate kinase
VQRVIITRAPFRISFAGGGSDIPAYYREHGGAVLSATIDSYIYISIHPYFNSRQTLLKYSKTELVDDVADIRHPLMREAVRELCPEGGIEISSTADVPSGTGLGSSSSFSVALYQALHAYRRELCTKEQLAEEACELEIVKLGEPIGKQDQYAAAIGGLVFYEFHPNDTVSHAPLLLPAPTLQALERNLLLFYTGDQRDTRSILSDQARQVGADAEKRRAQGRMVELAHSLRDALVRGETTEFARLLHEGWLLKRSLSAKISNPSVDEAYARALAHGTLGGKLLGAGGGGFLLLYCEEERQDGLRDALADLSELPFGFEWSGAQIVHVGQRHDRRGFFRGARKRRGP